MTVLRSAGGQLVHLEHGGQRRCQAREMAHDAYHPEDRTTTLPMVLPQRPHD